MKNRFIEFVAIVFVIFSLFSQSAQAEPCAESYCSELLVKFTRATTEDEAKALLTAHNLSIVDYFAASRIYHVDGDHTRSQDDIIKELNAEPTVMYAEPNYEVEANALPNDPLYENQWALSNNGQYSGLTGTDMGMEAVWNQLIAPDPIVVAVLDSGIDYTHEDLAANMWVNADEIPNNGRDDDGNGYIDDVRGYNFYNDNSDPADDYFHGTHVAGIIGAVSNNGVGIAGIDWNVKLMALKFMGPTGTGPLSAAIKAIDYAVNNGAKIINSSWNFYYAGTNGLPTSAALEPVQSLRDAIVAADNAGVIFIAAAGNDGLNDDVYPMYPAAYSVGNIISVAATDNVDALPAFSNFGAITVDIGAPGVLIESTYPTWKENPPYHFLSGTSMACPHVTGAAALLWAEAPNLTHRQIVDYLLQSARPIPSLNGKSVTGGTLDLAEAFVLDSQSVNHPPVANAGSTQYKTVGDSILLQGTATDSDGDAPLSFYWTLVSPNQEISHFSSAQISLRADLAGTYVATLVVSDAQSSSTPATSQIIVSNPVLINHAPVATASPIQLRHTGDTVTLQGSGTDSDGDPLTYKWTLTLPTGSHTTLSSTTTASTSFKADVTGTYNVSLTVNDGKTSSAPSTTKIYITTATSTNHAPVASAGLNQLRRLGDTVLLQASATDVENDALTYKWTLILPTGSHAILTNSTSATASFKPDVTGTYTATLIASDGKLASAAASAKIYVLAALTASTSSLNENIAYTNADMPSSSVQISFQQSDAFASPDPTLGGQVTIGESIMIDGGASTIIGSDSLTYLWTIIEKPVDSEAVLENPEQSITTFIPDKLGRYTVGLEINAGKTSVSGEQSLIAVEQALTETPPETTGNSGADVAPGCSLNIN